MTAKCQHCKTRKASRPRGLCQPCHDNTTVRALYAMRPGGYGSGAEKVTCWACGTESPRPTHLASVGWHVRKVRVEHYPMNEIYCPGCFDTWGWPDEGVTTKARVLSVLRDYPALTTADVVELTGLTRSAAWGALRRLRRWGVVGNVRGRRTPRRWALKRRAG